MQQLEINDLHSQKKPGQKRYGKNYDGSEEDSGSEDDEAQEIEDPRRAGKGKNRQGEMYQTFGTGE